MVAGMGTFVLLVACGVGADVGVDVGGDVGVRDQGSGPASRPATRPATQPTTIPTTTPAPQDGIPSRKDLAFKLTGAHRKGAAGAVDAFEAHLSVVAVGPKKNSITIELDSTFKRNVRWKDSRGNQNERALIRYVLDEQGKRLERGRDGNGFWFRSGNEVTSLEGKDFATDRQNVQKEIRLARQLLSYLDPGRTLQRLEGDTPVRGMKLHLGRGKQVDCWVVQGRLANYPFYSLDLEEGAGRTANVWMFVEKATGILRAVHGFDLGKQGKKRTNLSELVVLQEYHTVEGFKLPSLLYVSRFVAGEREPVAKIKILGTKLNPKLTLADFERPKSKRGKPR